MTERAMRSVFFSIQSNRCKINKRKMNGEAEEYIRRLGLCLKDPEKTEEFRRALYLALDAGVDATELLKGIPAPETMAELLKKAEGK